MRWFRWLVFGLIVASLGGGLDASSQNGQGEDAGSHGSATKHTRGNQQGSYVLKVTGRYSGQGTANVGATVSLQVKVTDNGGKSGMLVANNLPVKSGYFQGSGTVLGTVCKIDGRVDIASAKDREETQKQATTGRITGTFITSDGKVGRLVAVQGS